MMLTILSTAELYMFLGRISSTSSVQFIYFICITYSSTAYAVPIFYELVHMSDYGINNLAIRRVVELVNGYRDSIEALYAIKRMPHPLPYPEGLSDEDLQKLEDEAVRIIADADRKEVRIKDKLGKVVDRTLQVLDLNIDYEITVSSFGRTRVLGNCPQCSEVNDLIKAFYVDRERMKVGMVCESCGARKEIDIVG